jgi:hypothetical protein
VERNSAEEKNQEEVVKDDSDKRGSCGGKESPVIPRVLKTTSTVWFLGCLFEPQHKI